jgi:PAB-dependent poly(A)-specific ribonuclease subunit 3
MNAAMEQMSRNYSTELKDTIVWLLTPAQPPAHPKSIDDFIPGIANHILTTMNQVYHSYDYLHSEMFKELENSRLLRLVLKLGFIDERPEYENDRAWSDCGERYMLKLFRDYLFHQVDGNGNPVLDMGHVLRTLNRLDVGTDENIRLTSRDEQTSIIVSFKDLKKQLLAAFGDVYKASTKAGRSF